MLQFALQDEIIVFRQLTKPEVKEIADLMLKVSSDPNRVPVDAYSFVLMAQCTTMS